MAKSSADLVSQYLKVDRSRFSISESSVDLISLWQKVVHEIMHNYVLFMSTAAYHMVLKRNFYFILFFYFFFLRYLVMTRQIVQHLVKRV